MGSYVVNAYPSIFSIPNLEPDESASQVCNLNIITHARIPPNAPAIDAIEK